MCEIDVCVCVVNSGGGEWGCGDVGRVVGRVAFRRAVGDVLRRIV